MNGRYDASRFLFYTLIRLFDSVCVRSLINQLQSFKASDNKKRTRSKSEKNELTLRLVMIERRRNTHTFEHNSNVLLETQSDLIRGMVNHAESRLRNEFWDNPFGNFLMKR
jgi:hypothetical protein